MAALEEVFRQTMPKEMGYELLGISVSGEKSAARRLADGSFRPCRSFSFSSFSPRFTKSWSLPFSVFC